jgi:hypothetical protein
MSSNLNPASVRFSGKSDLMPGRLPLLDMKKELFIRLA